mmetsp:Transcript_4226/g.8080  ORF Transcript_4226/g.8080 Transcript_4226/m.8080 type:complete len:366 (+) Transcript_4226:36-1133(+)
MNSPSMDISDADFTIETTKRKSSPLEHTEDDEEYSTSALVGGRGGGNSKRPCLEEALQDKPIACSEIEDQSLTTSVPLHHHDKKHRLNDSESVDTIQKNDENSFHSTESLLAIPVRYILRQTSFQNKHPHLLSRMEASLLLQSNLLSYELDALLKLSIEAIEKSHACKQFSRDIAECDYNIYLRPLLCLLHTHGKVIPQQVVQYVQNQLEVILGHFPGIIQSLRQCAEQNWSVSNTLLGMNVDGMEIDLLGKEKGILAEIEEEVCRRLQSLMAICDEGGLLEGNVFEEESMEHFCERKFGMNTSTTERVNDPNNASNNFQKSAIPLAMQSRTKSINDAATALGMLASGGGVDRFDDTGGNFRIDK